MQRKIESADLDFPGWLNAPLEARATAVGLWVKATDAIGRCYCNPMLLSGLIYPGQAASDLILEHLVMLENSGFLQLYPWPEENTEVIALARPLKADLRGFTSMFPAPPRPHGIPREPAAVEGAGASERASAWERARARADERVDAEQADATSDWEDWRRRQDGRVPRPERPATLDAPPIGCPDHPEGSFPNCGPCGTARRQHTKFLDEHRYRRQWAEYEMAGGDDQ